MGVVAQIAVTERGHLPPRHGCRGIFRQDATAFSFPDRISRISMGKKSVSNFRQKGARSQSVLERKVCSEFNPPRQILTDGTGGACRWPGRFERPGAIGRMAGLLRPRLTVCDKGWHVGMLTAKVASIAFENVADYPTTNRGR